MKILFFGDIVGKIGRRAVREILPELRDHYQPDVIIANAENLAHGIGMTEKTIDEMVRAGINYFTSGNHTLDKPEAKILLEKKDSIVIRPANFPADTPGSGSRVIEVGSRKLLLVNLIGQVFIKEPADNPFQALDRILENTDRKELAGIIVDFHAEATSEKVAFGWYADGRVSAVVGTHTHIPTADAKILPAGTAYITDVGMAGAAHSVIGVDTEPIIKNFLGQPAGPFTIPESGTAVVNTVLVEIDPQTKKATAITRLDRTIEV